MTGLAEKAEIPYGKGTLPVMSAKAIGTCRGKILLHGENDSYIEEFFDALCYLQDRGFDVYLFEGPGQGGCLRELNMKFDPAWEKPVKAFLDHYRIDDVNTLQRSRPAPSRSSDLVLFSLLPFRSSFVPYVRICPLPMIPNKINCLLRQVCAFRGTFLRELPF